MKIFFRQKLILKVTSFTLIMLGGMLSMNTAFAATTLTLTSSGSQDINVGASAGSAISADSINVTTNCHYGYNLTLSTSVNDNNLYLNGDSSNNTAGTYFSPVDGTSALNATTNMWGYYYNGSTTPTSTSVFSPVPTLANPATVKTPLTTPASSDINDSFNIYYGVSVSPTMAKGTYKMIPDTNNSNNDGTIVYTATIADACTKYTVHFSPTSEFEGSTISGTGTMGDQTILEGITTPLTSNGFTAPSGYYFVGWNTAQDGSGTSYTDQQQVTDLITAGNTITLYAQWTDCPPKTVCYSSNVSNPSDVQGEMGNQAFEPARDWSSCSFTDYKTYCMDSNFQNIDINTLPELGFDVADLWAPNYKHNGYGFTAWNTNSSGTGTDFGPNQSLEFATEEYNTGGLKLYAKWLEFAGNMQSWSGCSGMSIGDITALKDARDNNVYAVAKLADGKCWMIENLRIDSSVTLSSANTHNPSLPLNNTWVYADHQTTLTTSNHLSTTVDPTVTAWCQNNTANCFNQSMLNTNNTTLFTNNTASSYSASGNVYSYGNYYNWYSATAGQGTYNRSSGNATGDICPAGWHLPTGIETTGEFWRLGTSIMGFAPSNNNYYISETNAAGDTALKAFLKYPNNFVRAGYANRAVLDYRNVSGLYWSSSANSNNLAYYLTFTGMEVRPSMSNSKYGGWTVRCIAGT